MLSNPAGRPVVWSKISFRCGQHVPSYSPRYPFDVANTSRRIVQHVPSPWPSRPFVCFLVTFPLCTFIFSAFSLATERKCVTLQSLNQKLYPKLSQTLPKISQNPQKLPPKPSKLPLLPPKLSQTPTRRNNRCAGLFLSVPLHPTPASPPSSSAANSSSYPSACRVLHGCCWNLW